MEASAQSMCQRMVNAQAGVGEGDTCRARGLDHARTAAHGKTVAIDHRQVLKHSGGSLYGECIGKRRGGVRDIGLDGVCQYVKTGIGRDLCRHGLGEIGLEQGAVGGQEIVDQHNLVLAARDDGKVGNFRTRTCRGRNGQKIRLVHSMLVGEVQNSLRGIDARTAAKGDDHIRLNALHHSDGCVNELLARVGLNVGIRLTACARGQVLSHLGDHARGLQKAIGDNQHVAIGQALKMIDGLRPKKQFGRELKALHESPFRFLHGSRRVVTAQRAKEPRRQKDLDCKWSSSRSQSARTRHRPA